MALWPPVEWVALLYSRVTVSLIAGLDSIRMVRCGTDGISSEHILLVRGECKPVSFFDGHCIPRRYPIPLEHVDCLVCARRTYLLVRNKILV